MTRWAIAMLGTMCVCRSAGAQVTLERIGRYDTGITFQSAAEIVAHDPTMQRLFVTNAASNAIDVLSIVDPSMPTLVRSIPLGSFGGGVNSVAVHNGLVAVAVEAPVKQSPGSVVFFDLEGRHLHTITVGALPDSLAFTPDGFHLLVANEGEPNAEYTIDPPGSVSVIAIPNARSELTHARARTAGFERFDLLGVPEGVRIFGPGATPSRDIEPEYITFNADASLAYVSCQENNALAVIDIASAQVAALIPLGTKDWMQHGRGFDASDVDGGVYMHPYPVHGLYQPDTIASYTVGGRTLIVTANEGEGREYPGYIEEVRVKDLTLDPSAFPDAQDLQDDTRLGRLKVSTFMGDTDGDGDYDRLYSFGARSISIWDESGSLIWDSGDSIERVAAERTPEAFNITNDRKGSFDDRSDDKGPEPEALAIGRLGGSVFAFCGLERTSGIVVFDITDPTASRVVGYTQGGVGTGSEEDLAPECMVFIAADRSPSGEPLLVVANEVSGSTTIYRILLEHTPATVLE
jgi:hypothetical protein